MQYARNRDHLTISGINKSTCLLVRTTRLLFDKRLDATTTARMLSLSTIQTHHVVHHGVTHEMTTDSIPTPNDFALMTIDLYISKIIDDNFDTVKKQTPSLYSSYALQNRAWPHRWRVSSGPSGSDRSGSVLHPFGSKASVFPFFLLGTSCHRYIWGHEI